jgi:hydantoinase/carbamoylase family amidase
LETKNIPIGIVEGIADLHRYLIKVKGQAGHAGTTPMHLRDDALVKAAEIIIRVHQAVQGGGAEVVGTIGEIQVYPGAINIIPAEVIMSLDLRSSRKDKLEAVCQTIKEIVSSLKNSTLEPILVKEGVPMDKQIKEIIAESCRQEGIAFCYLWSGAGHDAMTFPLVHIPTGMIFIPCKEGKSHCPEEEVSPAHAFLGTQVLAKTVRRLAS